MKKMIHGGDIYRHPDMIDFSSNCNPFGPPQSVQDAICRAAGQIGHYPDVQCSLLRDALSAKLHVPGAWIFFGNGAAEVIFAAVTALKPKKALLPAPTFAEYAQALETVGCEIQYEQTAEADGFALPMDFAEQITEDIDMVFLCNPNNPTGNLLSREDTERVIRRAGALGCTVVLDECFLDFVENPDEFSMLGELAAYPHVILLKAFTKLYAMAGARLGYGISSNPAIIEKLERSVQPWNVSSLAQTAGLAALAEDAYVRESLTTLRAERAYLLQALKKLGCRTYASQANYIFFRGETTLGEKLRAAGFLVRDCSNYAGLGKGYYRVAVRLHEDNVKLVQALAHMLD